MNRKEVARMIVNVVWALDAAGLEISEDNLLKMSEFWQDLEEAVNDE